MWKTKKQFNTIIVDGDGCIKLITTCGKKVIIDWDSLKLIGNNRICLDSRNYPKIWKDKKRVHIHRLINNTPKGMSTDHINGDKLDNRKCNLRTCTTMQNQHNSKGYSKTGYKGVSFHKMTGKYQASLSRENSKQYYIGLFNTKKDAAIAYNKLAKKVYGEFAWLNKITEE